MKAVIPLAMLVACNNGDGDVEDEDLANTLFVGLEGSLASFDIATGEQRAGEVQDVTSPVDLQVLDDGTAMLHLTERNEILAVDGRTMLEVARLPSSLGTGTRPVHSYLTPIRDGRQYWVSMNDGEDSAATNSAQFVDVSEGSDARFEPVGEVPLGIGHHKAAFSTTVDRVVISNISDCDDVLSVFDYSDPANVTKLATFTSTDAGFDGSSFPKTCDPTYQAGLPVAPHGCATSPESGKAYCNLTSPGEIVAVDLDANPPTFARIATTGSGGGYTVAHPDGRYVYSLQESPREGDGGAACQIGQIVAIDATTGTVTHAEPLFYDGPGCTRALAGTDEETANPGHMQMHPGLTEAFVTLAGGFGVDGAVVRKELVLDLSMPAHPMQVGAFDTGQATSHRGDACDGTGSFLFVVDSLDGTVTQYDIAAATTSTIPTGGAPKVIATWGDAEGPSHQAGPFQE